MPTLKYKDPTTGEWKIIRSGGTNNKVPIDAEIANNGDYIYARDTLGNPVMIAKADMVSLIADAIKANEEEQRKVTFGSASLQELQETIGDNLYGATDAAGLASVVAGSRIVITDANSVTTDGIYKIASNAANMPPSVRRQSPIRYCTMLYITTDSSYSSGLYLLFSYTSGVFFRLKTQELGFDTWYKLSDSVDK